MHTLHTLHTFLLEAVMHVPCTVLMPRVISSAFHAASAVAATASRATSDRTALLVRRRDGLFALGRGHRRVHILTRRRLFAQAVQLLTLLLLLLLQLLLLLVLLVLCRHNVVIALVQTLILASQVDYVVVVVVIRIDQVMLEHVDR